MSGRSLFRSSYKLKALPAYLGVGKISGPATSAASAAAAALAVTSAKAAPTSAAFAFASACSRPTHPQRIGHTQNSIYSSTHRKSLPHTVQ